MQFKKKSSIQTQLKQIQSIQILTIQTINNKLTLYHKYQTKTGMLLYKILRISKIIKIYQIQNRVRRGSLTTSLIPDQFICFYLSTYDNQKYFVILFSLLEIQQIFVSQETNFQEYQVIIFYTIICYSFSPINPIKKMDCFCSSSTKKIISVKGKFSKEIQFRLCSQQIAILHLIYEDLASRNQQNKLSFQNFLDFFDLAGLWGVKLFQQFDLDHMELISFEEFLYGISKTAKAPFDEKIKLLYLFFQKEINSGIEFKKFVKMLYNYSKQELKEILITDGLIKCTQQQGSNKKQKSQTQTVVELCIQSPDKPPVTAFQNAYNCLLSVHDQGTYLQINQNSLKYKIKYNNMSTLIKQFAENVYLQHGINIHIDQKGRLSYESFSKWIKSHKKLYKSYYSSFHPEIWEVINEQPSYLNQHVDLQFVGKIECGPIKGEVYCFQVEDIIIICKDKKSKRKAIKIVCLQGLMIRDTGDLRIQFSHHSNCYKNFYMVFTKQQQHKAWLKSLSIYQRQSINNSYIINEVIGTGRYSIVYKCIQKATKKTYALKVIQYQKLTPSAREAIRNQSQILKVLNHPQILKYNDTVYTKTNEYIITQYIYGEDLYQYVKRRKYLNQFQSAFIIGNIMNGVMYLHELEIMHRDLKPQNIMVMFKQLKVGEYFQCTIPQIRKGQRIQNIKIIDFGLSNHISNLEKMDRKKLSAGTPNYIAPQLILGEENLTLKSDNFSIGAILYFLLKGTLPFARLNIQKTILNTVGGVYDLQSDHWDNISEEAKDLIQKLLEVDPQDRIQLSQAINHEWFNKIHCKNLSSGTSGSDSNQYLRKANSRITNVQDEREQNINTIRRFSNIQRERESEVKGRKTQ